MSAAIAIREAKFATTSLQTLTHSLTTPSVGSVNESSAWPVLTRYSTSPLRACNYQLVFVDEDVALLTESGALALGAQALPWAEIRQERAQTFDTVSDINWFRQTLELGMAEIASLFNVTRKAVYDWTNETKTVKAPYIKAVRSLIERELTADLRPYLQQFWESSPQGEKSLLDILKSGDAQSLQNEATHAIRALAKPISDYVSQIHADLNEPTVAHLHNYDEYRHF